MINYTIHWTVTGNEPANNMVITDAIPANTTYWSCSSCGYFGSYVQDGTVVYGPGYYYAPYYPALAPRFYPSSPMQWSAMPAFGYW